MEEQEKFIEDEIIELAVTKGYLKIPSLEVSVSSVVRWIWLAHKIHIYTKVKDFPQGLYF